MSDDPLICQDDKRRQASRAKGLNGIDDVEVLEDGKLCVHFFGKIPDKASNGKPLGPANVRIEGGRRIREIQVLAIDILRSDDPELDDCLRVTVDRQGDFSTYRLCVVGLDGFDPRYSCIDFSFKVDCPTDMDCKDEQTCPPEVHTNPDINYLAKDYASFRQLILDRLSLLMPDWKERHVPDLGITLVEVLAYAGDYLSYYQDAVATEAYLDTARLRISVRRHARLVDYTLHEGCNARAWVCIWVEKEFTFRPADLFFVTGAPELETKGARVLQQSDLEYLSPGSFEVFEPLVPDAQAEQTFYPAHNHLRFYTWGDEECCLPKGATRATLLDAWVETSSGDQVQQVYQGKSTPPQPSNGEKRRLLQLKPGDFLLLYEAKGPLTGDEADADPARRHVVRLTNVEAAVDPLNDTPLLEVTWSAADALPFSLCASSQTPAPHCLPLEDVSLACGNLLLVDHGRSLDPQELGSVSVKLETGECDCEGAPAEMTFLPAKFEPRLPLGPVTYRQAPRFARGKKNRPASRLVQQDPRQALPVAWLESGVGEWRPRVDLLESSPDDLAFVVEVDDDGQAHLRFGDGDLGRLPPARDTFRAHYRIGNGQAGNVGRDSIRYLVFRVPNDPGFEILPDNPLPATGGVDPEPVSQARLLAPTAFKTERMRAITGSDYAELALRNPSVQRAAGTLQWTGSWYEANVAIDPLGRETLGAELRRELKGLLYPFRRIGHDLEVAPARYVPLLLELEVCVLPGYLRGHVEAALLERFSSRVGRGGRPGFFHPDALTFGEGVAVSAVVAAAQAVAGVESVVVTKLERLFAGPNHELEDGILPLKPGEIAQLDNDPSFPENGKLVLDMKGGR